MTLFFLGLFAILIALVVKSTLGKPNLLIKVLIHSLGGFVGLWLVDLLLSVAGITIPINLFTVILVGFLGFPGVIALAGLQILGI